MDAPHIPVMAEEAVYWLNVRPGGVYVDATAGAGGHSVLIAERLAGRGRLLALDRDPDAVALAGERLAGHPVAAVFHANYSELNEVLRNAGESGADGVLIDAGVSSMQIDRADRGFSFQADGPLDMRMDTSRGPTAAEWLRSAREAEVAAVLRAFGDVGPAGRIARTIAERCAAGRMTRSGDLAEAVRAALHFVRGTPDEIRTVFQAVRMAVNDELGALGRGVAEAVDALRPGGRLVVISFHSGEDRTVKELLRAFSRTERVLGPDGRTVAAAPPRVRLPLKKPLQPGPDECLVNPRAKSARMRVAERLDAALCEEREP